MPVKEDPADIRLSIIRRQQALVAVDQRNVRIA
jgi:hypothetical protein